MQTLKFFAVLFIWFTSLAFANEDELLPPEQAFALSATLNNEQQITLHWSIAEGYYLYKQKLNFIVNGQEIGYAAVDLPRGTPVDDPLFGRVEIYKNQLEFTLNQPDSAVEFDLMVSYQGCYEPLGICYPPQTQQFNLMAQAPIQPARLSSPAKTGVFSQGSVFAGGAQSEYLEVDEAFKFVVVNTDPNRLVANFEAAPGYYLYKPHIKFNIESPHIILSDIDYPQGVVKDDPHFGEIEVYYGNATIPITLTRLGETTELRLTATYQGCAEEGICYQPQTRQTVLTLKDAMPGTAATTPPDKGLIWYLLAAFGGGLLLTFTPCVLPMIPILSGIIMAERDKGGLNHAGLLSWVYVMGTATSYSVIGAVAGASGEQLQAYFQTPLAIGILSLVLILMALSMFGLFKLQIPAFMQTNLTTHSDKLAGGGVLSIFVMGMISALIVGACVSPLLISSLSIAIAKGSAVLGAALMFCMAMGMGVILLIFGFGFGHLVPRVGVWMTSVNKIIGFLLFAVAIYLLSFVPVIPVLFLWSFWLIAVAIFLFNKQISQNWSLFVKPVAVISLTWGVLAFIGGLNGYRDITNPLPIKQLFSGGASKHPINADLFHVVTSNGEIDALFARARAENKFVLLDYYADWCLDCLRMQDTTFKSPVVTSLLGERFISIKVDVTDASDDAVKSVKKRFNVFGPPAALFFSPQGEEFTQLKFYGYRNTEEFMQILKQVTG